MFVCGVFVDLRKAFDTVDLNILLHKLSYYGIRDIANCYKKYSSRQRHVVLLKLGVLFC